MPQLRLTLLVVGLIFLIGLAWWELRRPRQARGSDLAGPQPAAPEPATAYSADWDSPPLELPRMSARSPELDLPVVEVAAAEFAALEAQAVGVPESALDSALESGPEGGMEGLLDELGANQVADPPISDLTEASEVTAVTEAFEAAAPAPEPPAAEPVPHGAPKSVVVDWPAADASQVLAVRVISSGEKFSGRAVRLALAAEGFELGKFSIFHKPAPDGRALLSIASLNKPGTFDSQSIDLQRYSGLNLFTVLPGPVSGPDAVDEMLMCAQVLSQRLRGTLQDERGEPLSPARTAIMRNVAAAAPP
jgi:FtsZ-interacting cell division protein ZipA